MSSATVVDPVRSIESATERIRLGCAEIDRTRAARLGCDGRAGGGRVRLLAPRQLGVHQLRARPLPPRRRTAVQPLHQEANSDLAGRQLLGRNEVPNIWAVDYRGEA
jgi:hypothetical protein